MKRFRFFTVLLALILLLPLFAAAAGAEDTVIYLSDLDTVKHDLIKSAGITNGINQGLQQKKMSVNGRVFEKGFCTHPVDADNPSVITVDVSRYSTDYPVFHTVMGKDDITKDGGTGLTVVLCIYVDGKEVYMSDLLDLGDVVELYLDVEGAKEIQLLCFAASTFAWLTADFGDTYLCNYKVKEVRLAKAPIKKEYMVGEKLSRVGGVIETEYENGAVARTEVEEDMISGFDPDKVGTQQLTVTYKDHVFTYSVTVKDSGPVTETVPVTETETEPETETETEADIQTKDAETTEEKTEQGGGNSRIIIVIAAAAVLAAACAAAAVIIKRRGRTKGN
jgi:hypothetical protein